MATVVNQSRCDVQISVSSWDRLVQEKNSIKEEQWKQMDDLNDITFLSSAQMHGDRQNAAGKGAGRMTQKCEKDECLKTPLPGPQKGNRKKGRPNRYGNIY